MAIKEAKKQHEAISEKGRPAITSRSLANSSQKGGDKLRKVKSLEIIRSDWFSSSSVEYRQNEDWPALVTSDSLILET